jgi:hypothetical protein
VLLHQYWSYAPQPERAIAGPAALASSMSSASTSSTSWPASPAVSESCSLLTAACYLGNAPRRVTLNRASDGKNRRNRPGLRIQ